MTEKAKPSYEELERRILELEKAESELRFAKDQFQNIFDNAQDAIFIHDLEGNILDVNDKMCRMYGLTKEEALKVTIEDVSSSKMSMKVLLERWQTVLNGEKLFFKWEAVRPEDKSVFNVEVSIQKISSHDQDIVLANVRDITERERIENENLVLADIIKRSQDFIGVADMEGNLFFVNPAGQSLIGLNGDEAVKGTTIKDYFTNEDRVFVEETILSTLMTEGRWYGEYRFRHFKTGAAVPLLFDLFLTENPETGQVTNITTISRDITERKRAEEALRKSENQINSIFRSAPVGIGSVVNRVLIKVNDCLCEMTGYDETELTGQSARMLYPIDKAFECGRRKNYAGIADRGMGMVATRWQKKDGTIMDVLLSSTPVNPEDHSKGVTFTALDITERKRAEDELKSNYALLQIAGETAKFGGWSVDLVNNICTWSDAVADIHEVPHGYAPPVQEAINFYAPEWQEMIKQIFSACAQEGIPYDEEMEIITQKGKRVWVRATGEAVKNEKDEILKVQGSFQDITDSKHQKERLRLNESRYKKAQALAKVGNWEYNLKTTEFWGSDEAKKIYGIALDRDSFSTEEVESCIIERERIHQAMVDLIEHEKPYNLEFDIVTKDTGRIKTIVSIAEIEIDVTKDPKISGVIHDITERKLAEEELRRRENQLQRIFEILPIGLWFADRDGTLLRGNPKGIEIWGAEPTVPISEYGVFKAWHLPSRKPVLADEWALAKTIRSGETVVNELLEIEAFDGKRKTILNYTAPLQDGDGQVDGAIVVNLDISERIALEDQLLQAQKMESVGRLAGGVAHDFNNMLSVILGHAEMALENLEPTDPLFASLQAVQHAAERSAALTRQLLAFARKQTVAPKVIDLNETVEGMLNMLRRLIGENIDLLWKPGGKLAPVKMDPSQIDQILANLGVNSRDAIADVGKITIETDVVSFDEAYCAIHAGFVPGEFVLLAVSDDGCGMDKKTIGHLFEPFFTTKEQGRGTGLGLASVYGVVKQNNGFINVYSEPGQGTIFRIYLPTYTAKSASVAEKVSDSPAERGYETILLVEDEPAILEMIRRMLERLGYTVLAAGTPGEAIRLAEENFGRIDLLLTDVVMPEMNGRDLAKKLLSSYPDIRRLFMSGYTANVIAHHGVLDEGVHFIQKPFPMKDLGGKLREALES